MVGRVKGAIPLFAAVVCGLVACGGEDSGSRDYREGSNALCREATREASGLTPPRTRRDWEVFLRDTLAFSRDYTERGRALEPPPELAAQHERSERLNLRAERVTENVLDDIEAGDPLKEVLPGYFKELLEISRRSNDLARAMDLPDCVVPLLGPGEAAPAPA
jgi:hypothetical protein